MKCPPLVRYRRYRQLSTVAIQRNVDQVACKSRSAGSIARDGLVLIFPFIGADVPDQYPPPEAAIFTLWPVADEKIMIIMTTHITISSRDERHIQRHVYTMCNKLLRAVILSPLSHDYALFISNDT